MSRFNQPVSGKTRTTNKAGGEAFVQSPQLQFVSAVLTSFVQDQYYRSADEVIEEIVGLIDRIPDKAFCAKTAVFARTKFGMRSVSHLVAAELAQRVKGEQWSKRFYEKVVYRPDDISEILAYYLNRYGKPIPNSLKKGLALAFGRFDEYQLAKYRVEKASLSLVDVANLIHPKPTEKNKAALEKLIKGNLRSLDTWESELTRAGQDAENEDEKEALKSQAWTRLIKEKKIGYFALLRNLRNILEQAPEVVDEALALLTDEKLIRKSLVLPFRFTTAIKQIEQLNADRTRDTLVALNRAVEIALTNVPKLEGKTLVVLDSSGSMIGRPIEIGSLFAAVLFKSNNADYMTFSDNAEYVTLNPMDSVLTIAHRIEENAGFGGTNFHSIFEEANRPYDRIIILSDMQGWVGYDAPTKSFAEYKSRVGASPVVYSFDLAGYGTLQLPEQGVYCLAGFSEKVFDVMKLLETDKKALLSEIEKVEL